MQDSTTHKRHTLSNQSLSLVIFMATEYWKNSWSCDRNWHLLWPLPEDFNLSILTWGGSSLNKRNITKFSIHKEILSPLFLTISTEYDTEELLLFPELRNILKWKTLQGVPEIVWSEMWEQNSVPKYRHQWCSTGIMVSDQGDYSENNKLDGLLCHLCYACHHSITKKKKVCPGTFQ